MKFISSLITVAFLTTLFIPGAFAAEMNMNQGKRGQQTSETKSSMKMKKMKSMNSMKKKMKSMPGEMSLFGMDSLASGLKGLDEGGFFQSMTMGKANKKEMGKSMAMKKGSTVKNMGMGSILMPDDEEMMEEEMKTDMVKKMKEKMKKDMKKKMKKKMEAEMEESMPESTMIQMPRKMEVMEEAPEEEEEGGEEEGGM